MPGGRQRRSSGPAPLRDEALQRDHSRDNELTLLDWERLRFTTGDVTERLGSCVAIVRAVERRLRASPRVA